MYGLARFIFVYLCLRIQKQESNWVSKHLGVHKTSVYYTTAAVNNSVGLAGAEHLRHRQQSGICQVIFI